MKGDESMDEYQIRPEDMPKEQNTSVGADIKKEAMRTFSIIGFAIFAIIFVVEILQGIAYGVFLHFFGEEVTGTWFFTLSLMGILYFIGIPLGTRMIRKLPVTKISKKNLSVGELLFYFVISMSFMYFGNLFTRILLGVLSGITGQEFGNPIESFLTGNNLAVTVLIVVIMAPIAEEYLCRKLIIDRTVKYGEWVAIFSSAMIFGLFHRNLFQFFYAFLLGLVFGYIYVKTGKVIYTMVLHMIVNFFGGVVSLFMLNLVGDSVLNNFTMEEFIHMTKEQMMGWMIMGVYGIFILLLAITGIILFLVHRKKIVLLEGEYPIPKKERFKIIFLNPGMLILVVISVIASILFLFSAG